MTDATKKKQNIFPILANFVTRDKSGYTIFYYVDSIVLLALTMDILLKTKENL